MANEQTLHEFNEPPNPRDVKEDIPLVAREHLWRKGVKMKAKDQIAAGLIYTFTPSTLRATPEARNLRHCMSKAYIEHLNPNT
ncbi:hypothetical protein RRF57_001720 [Xylaria bambusicola]|uniref:Uncharacterized protein n=1 Tax=Xylaria bambusicola TaxID=326684 RepID=A0AAN7UBZ1_9PEZI